jgi:hypothetical protein
MSGLLFLATDDFSIQRGTKGNIMCTSIPGFSLILFYSTDCQHCRSIIPIFKSLPGTINGCQFGMINVSQNKHTVHMSRETIAPINVVPYIVLHINGKPYMRYNGPYLSEHIVQFIVDVSKNMQLSQSQTNKEQNNQQKETSGIPAYTIGIPLCGTDENVCYLDFDEAYNSDKVKQK